MKTATISCVTVLLLAACQSPVIGTPRRTVIATDAITYSPFDTVKVTATNIGGDTLYGYGCPVNLEIRTSAGAWRTVSPQPADISTRPCVDALRRWPPGAAWSISIGLDGAKAGGVYRFRFDDLRNSTSVIDASDRISTSFGIR